MGSQRKVRKILVDELGVSRKVRVWTPRCASNASHLSPTLYRFRADDNGSEQQQQKDGPGRAYPQCRAVVAQARHRDEEALNLGRKLEKIHPFGVSLQSGWWLHVKSARDGGYALVEAEHRLELVSHPCSSPDVVRSACPAAQRAAGRRTKIGEESEDWHGEENSQSGG
eukprot:4209322-Prymnesium_polylepis.1